MTLTIWLAPLTIGLSQENQDKEVCLPEHQVKVLLEDAKTLIICNQELLLKDSLIFNFEKDLLLQDSTVVLLNNKLSIKDEQIKNLEAQQDQWWVKYGWLLMGILVGVGANEITN